MAATAKEVKTEPNISTDAGSTESAETKGWFTSRRYPDEVTLKFDDGRELYVSREFLMYSSPVFEAMFTHEMKEKRTGIVELRDKRFDMFLELLMCIHPRFIKPVTRYLAVPLMVLSQEYQIEGVLVQCKMKLKEWVHSLYTEQLTEDKKVNTCLKIPRATHVCHEHEIIDAVSQLLSNFKIRVVSGTTGNSGHAQENVKLFKSLDVSLLNLIFQDRLARIDN